MKTLISGGTVINASGPFAADVFVDGDVIVGLSAPGTTTSELWRVGADRVIDATGQYVIPGAIDGHTHLEMPFGGTHSVDTFETGTRAAAFGGTTTVIDFAIQSKGKSLREGLDAWHAKAEGNCAVDYGFHMIVSDVNEASLKEMDLVVDE
jgi:dihydropyrimidinase